MILALARRGATFCNMPWFDCFSAAFASCIFATFCFTIAWCHALVALAFASVACVCRICLRASCGFFFFGMGSGGMGDLPSSFNLWRGEVFDDCSI